MKHYQAFQFTFESWLQCNIVTGISFALVLIAIPLVAAVLTAVVPLPVSLLIGAAVSGAIIGLAQWHFLGLDVEGVARWMFASAIGWSLALALLLIAPSWPLQLPGIILAALLAGLLPGACQSVVLSHEVRRRVAWIVSTALGWVVVMAVALWVGRGLDPAMAGDTGAVGVIAVSWVIMAMLMAFGLIVLFPKREEKSAEKQANW